MAFTQTPLASNKVAATATTITVNVSASAGDVLFATCCWVTPLNSDNVVFSDPVNGTWTSLIGGAGKSDLQVIVNGIGFGVNPVVVTGTMSSTTVTATISVSRAERIIAIWKLPGSDMTTPIANDTTGASNTATSATATPGSKTPTFNPDYEVFVVASDSSTVTSWSTPANYTSLFAISGPSSLTQLGVFGLTNPTVSNTATNPSSTSGAGSVLWVAGQVFYKAFVAAVAGPSELALLGVG